MNLFVVWGNEVAYRNKRKLRYFSIVLVLVGVCVAVQHVFIPSFSYSEMLSSMVSYPVLVAQRSIVVPTQQFFQRLRSRDELEARYQTVQQQYLDLMAENIKLRASLHYYESVAQVTDFAQRYIHKKAVVAQVLIRNIGPDVHRYVLDKGARHGVQKDMVALYKNCLLGKITQVYPLHCELTLITDNSCRVSAVCIDTKTAGIHVGTNHVDSTVLQRVSHLAVVKEGDLVVSSGEGLIFPQGFALGRIQVIEPDALYTKITLKPLCDMATIDYCLLVKKGECDAVTMLEAGTVALGERD
jgi:rod shape-determining protein MreC